MWTLLTGDEQRVVISGEEARSAATRLLDEARREPPVALEQGRALIQQINERDHVARSIAFRGLAIAARLGSSINESLDFGQKALEEAEMSGQSSLRSEALMTLSGAMAIAGDNDGALTVLHSAYEGTSGQLEAAIASQEGAIRHRLGQTRLAMECYARALPVFRDYKDFTSVAMTLNNIAMLRIDSGDFIGAKRDLEEVRALDLTLGHESEAANADHNLGIVASRMGNIPEALRLFDHSEQRLVELAGSAAEVRVSRVEVLLSAGLIREALGMSMEIAGTLHDAGFAEDEAEARLVGAQAALLAGDLDSALRWTDISAQMFDQQRRAIWAASAGLVGIQAQHEAGLSNSALVLDARRIAEVLEAEGQMIPAFNARLTAGRMGIDLGLLKTAREDLERVSQQKIGPVELRLQSRLAGALLRLSYGDRAGADAAARAGMRLLDDYQAALGATDIRSGVERHGASLGELGLRLALDSRKPRRAFAWMERTRARALRHRPVTPVDDHVQAADLAELRQVSGELRSAEGDRARDLSRQEQALQETIRNRGRLARGEGSKAPMTVNDLVEALGDRTLVEFASLDDWLWAVVVRNGRLSLAELGSEPSVLTELESLRFTMRRLSRQRGNASTELARLVAVRLDEMLFGKLRTGTGPVVIVPTPVLHSMPWAALPTCEGRAFTVAPSAELWWRAARRRRRSGSVVVAAGPDLAHAGAEASEVAALYSGVEAVDSAGATVDRLRTLLDRAATGHIACHARFEVDNPMFSSLRLTDGDLNVYDLERMRRVPDLVVLSACDSGFTEAHPGEELMGLSSALLSLGAKSLVASVGLVPDSEATRELMVGLHRGLISGLGPAEALNRARDPLRDTTAGYVAAASFVCIGAG